MKSLKINLLLLGALLALTFGATWAFAQNYTDIKAGQTLVCPEGFHPIPSGLACAASNLSIEPTYPLDTGRDCPRGFEHVAGVPFCVAVNLALSVRDDTLLLEGLIDDGCPPNFSVATGSTICTADNLVVKDDRGVAEIAVMDIGCPDGFHRPHGVRFCVAEDLTSSRQLEPLGQLCPPGFAQPPGVRFCIATNFLYQIDQRQLPPPQGECPQNWVKPENGNFCVPGWEIQPCGNNPECVGNGGFEGLMLQPVVNNFVATPCPAGTVEIWWDMPVYDKDGLFVVDFIPTKTCIDEDLQPAG